LGHEVKGTVRGVDRAAVSRIAHGELPFFNPLSEGDVDAAIDLLDLRPGARVLDVACGNAEVLRRIAARWDVEAVGYDSDAELIGRARVRAPKLRLLVADEPPAERFDLVVCIASSHALGGFPAALARLRALGERVLLGEGYWRREPSPGYLDALGGATRDELADYPGLFEAAAAAGLAPVWVRVASERDWDHYEWTQVLNAERHGGVALCERAEAARRRLTMPGGRDTLGFALVLFRPAEPS
jgi:SAM-dependent methyltransferase